MKLRVGVIAVLCIGLSCGLWSISSQVHAQGKAAPVEPKITVLNPMGTPPAIEAKAMVEPLKTLEGKTLYFVNTGYIGTDRLMAVMTDWFKTHYPNTKIVMARGSMTSIPANVMKEIGEKADAAIVGLGH